MINNSRLLDRIKSGDIKVIIFDFDGTLLDIREALKKSIDEIFKEYNLEVDMDITLKEIGAILESVQGYPLPKIILQSHQIFKYVETLKEVTYIKKLQIATKIFSRYREYQEEAEFFPGIEDFISKLNKNYDLYILSHNQKQSILAHLEKKNLINKFSGIFGADNLPALKPDPIALNPILKQYNNISSNSFVMIGDMPTDIEAAQEAGIWSVGISTGISDTEFLKEFSPDLLLNSIDELYQIFNSN